MSCATALPEAMRAGCAAVTLSTYAAANASVQTKLHVLADRLTTNYARGIARVSVLTYSQDVAAPHASGDAVLRTGTFTLETVYEAQGKLATILGLALDDARLVDESLTRFGAGWTAMRAALTAAGATADHVRLIRPLGTATVQSTMNDGTELVTSQTSWEVLYDPR